MSWLSKLRNAFHPKQLDNDLSGIARIAGASFLFSLRNLFAVEKGFDARGVAVIDISNELTGKEAQSVFLDQFQRRIAALPGIQGATTAEWAIFEESTNTDQVTLPGKPPSEKEPIFYRISPGYFATLRTPLLSGRDFEPRDRNVRGTGQPVPAIVNQAFAQRYFGDENPLGKTFQRAPVNHRIVGVAANAHYASLREGAEPIVYTPLEGGNYFALHVRSPLDLGSVVRMVERAATARGSGTRVREVTTLDTLIGDTLLREKLLAGIGGVFALLGLLLAAIGLFGLLNYSVTRRTKEIGIRAALGARPPSLVFLVLRDMFGMIAGGLAASLALMTFVRSLLFGIGPLDPLVMTTAAAVFLGAAFIAGGLPASRAASIDPMVALRHE